MATGSSVMEPILPTEQEASAIMQLATALEDGKSPAYLVSPSGTSIAIPHSVFQLLRDVIAVMSRGQAVQLVPLHQELTTQQAAELLNVSRPFLIKLLESGAIPYRKVGTHRRVYFRDLMAYKHGLDKQTEAGLTELAGISEEAGLYDLG